jgi:hypothetical protein
MSFPNCPHAKVKLFAEDGTVIECSETDKFCLLESSDKCETYEEWLKEEKDERD